jgi:hypothetical protein
MLSTVSLKNGAGEVQINIGSVTAGGVVHEGFMREI